MTESETSVDPRPRRRPARWLAAVFLVLVAGAGVLAITLPGRPVVLPAWATAQIEERLNRGLGDSGATLGQTIVEFDRTGVPQVRLRNVALFDARDVRIATLNEVRAALSLPELMRGVVVPSDLQVSGAQITVRRSVDGTFAVSFGEGATPAMADMANAVGLVDTMFAQAPMANIARLDASDLTISLEDARSGRVWQVTDGTLRLINDADSVSVTVVSEVFNGTEDLAEVQLSFVSNKGAPGAAVGMQFSNAAAQDIALQSPALSYLGVLDAPVSGAIRTVLTGDGAIDRLAATLEIDSGALQPAVGVRPVPFNSARAYLEYDPEEQRIAFSELSVQSEALQVVGAGHAYLRDFTDGWPQSLLGQMQFEEIALTPDGMFSDPVLFDAGMADFRMRLDPFELDLGQAVLLAGEDRLAAEGRVGADDAGWKVDVDLSGDRMTPEQLMGLWPPAALPPTRAWLARNVLSGELTDIVASLRLAPELRPRVGFSFDFKDASVRYMPHMPIVTGGAGHAALVDGRYAMRLEAGRVRPAGQRPIDFTGSTLAILDVSEKIPMAELDLRGTGQLASVLTALDNHPFRILEKSGRTADLAAAAAAVEAKILFRLAKDIKVEDVAFDVAGQLTGFTSDTLVPNRLLAGETLNVRVRSNEVEVAGLATLDGVPVDAVWRQSLVAGAGDVSRVDARIGLDQVFLDTFGINLPPGTVSGRAEALVQLEIPRDGPVAFDLNSDLRGAGVQLGTIGWTKPSNAAGSLSISGSFAPEVQIDRVRLAGAGLEAEGVVSLGAGGALEAANFQTLRIGDWLSAPVRLEGRGTGVPPTVILSGGRLDLRGLPQGQGQPSGPRVPIQLALDELVVEDGIVLRPFTARLTAGAGLDGEFEGRLEGRTPVRGALVPQRGRSAIRVLSDDAGAALRDAGIFRTLAGGELDLVLAPRAEEEGFDGRLSISSARLRDQPAIADLLDAISVVGLIDQLQGPGILFNTIEGRFTLTPEALTLNQGSAVGASLGVSLDGTFDIANEVLNMQGVISPIYLLNAVGQVLTRRGEGLLGFTFRVTGDADDPRVSVNPLSILAPGMLREILRGAPPGSEEARRRQIPSAEDVRGDP